MICPEIDDINKHKHTKSWIHHEYPAFYDFILNNSSYIDCRSWGERIYRYYNNIDTHPICPICGKRVSFLDPKKGYRKYCSPKCANHDPEYRSNIKDIVYKKYGVDNVAKLQESTYKAKLTRTIKYGDANYNNRSKATITCMQKYGVLNPGILRTMDVVSYNKINDMYEYECPHPNKCSKCDEHTYQCSRNIHNNRKKLNIELCTKLSPVCDTKISGTNIELTIRRWLDEFGVEYVCNDREVIYPQELDIYIPSKHIAIECNGLYWHSDVKVSKSYHYDKFIKCKDAGIQLISLWEDQINIHPDKIKSILLSKLGIYQDTLYARMCKVTYISNDIAYDFIDKYHLQGGIRSDNNIGLYYNDDLVSVMTFGNTRRCCGKQKNDTNKNWELYRYCCKPGYRIIGGASKMLKLFTHTHNVNSIISFSSNDISDGGLYQALGFVNTGCTIGYWYIYKNKRYHRYNFTKHKLQEIMGVRNDNLTEYELATMMGAHKVYDSGQMRWELNLL